MDRRTFRAEDVLGEACPLMKDVAEASFEGGHIVLNVGKGGEDYSVSYLTAEDESMTVKCVMRFKV